ncbi:MAG: MFS transporter [Ktedonobacterales bacterium]|nr:MFS transporter [Ktedonobacterales bacterium]
MATHAKGTPVTTKGTIWHGERRFLTMGLLLVVAGTAFDALAVSTALPVTARELGGLSLYGWAFSAFALTDLIGIVVAGREADRYGSFVPFAAGTVLFVAGLLIAGSAPTMAVVIIGRAVQGLGSGAIVSVAYVAVGRGYPEADKPRMLALLATAWVVPGLIGPGIGGVVAERLGWRWIFLGLAIFVVLAAASAVVPMRRIAPAANTSPRDWQRIGAAIALACGVTVLQAAPQQHQPWLVALLSLSGGGLLVVTLPRLLPRGTWRAAAGLPAVVALTALLHLAFFGVDSFVPLALTNGRGQSATFAGLALTASTLCWSVGARAQERGVQRFSRRAVAWAGLASIGLGIALVLLVLQPSVSVWLVIPAWGVGGFGMGLTYTTLTLTMLGTAVPGHEGEASSATELAGMLSFALATGLGGVIISMAHGGASALRGSLAVQFTLMLLAVGVAALAARNLPSDSPH